MECDDIPNNRQEVHTPEVAKANPHLSEIASELHLLRTTWRWFFSSLEVLEQILGLSHSSYTIYAIRFWLGSHWRYASRQSTYSANKVTILPNVRTAFCDPFVIHVPKKSSLKKSYPWWNTMINTYTVYLKMKWLDTVFKTNESDDHP